MIRDRKMLLEHLIFLFRFPLTAPSLYQPDVAHQLKLGFHISYWNFLLATNDYQINILMMCRGKATIENWGESVHKS